MNQQQFDILPTSDAAFFSFFIPAASCLCVCVYQARDSEFSLLFLSFHPRVCVFMCEHNAASVR